MFHSRWNDLTWVWSHTSKEVLTACLRPAHPGPETRTSSIRQDRALCSSEAPPPSFALAEVSPQVLLFTVWYSSENEPVIVDLLSF